MLVATAIIPTASTGAGVLASSLIFDDRSSETVATRSHHTI